MATLIAKQGGNFQAAGQWGLVSAEGLNLTVYGGQVITNAYAYCVAFTVTAGQVIEGILMHIGKASAGVTGTVTACLALGGAPISGCEVTLDVANLAATLDYQRVFFKFDSPHTAAGGLTYSVGLKTSAINVANSNRISSTANGWCRALRLATTQAPVASDTLYAVGEAYNGGVHGWTLTYGETVEIAYGSLYVGFEDSTVQVATGASTAYLMKINGTVYIEAGGHLILGSVATPMPDTSSFKLTIQLAADVGNGLYVYNGGELLMQGNPLAYDRCHLANDETVGQTQLTTDVATGWKSGDKIAVASTDNDRTHTGLETLNGDAAGTILTISAPTSYLHLGTPPFAAEIIHLTRNVVLTTTSASYRTFINVAANGMADCDWVEFINFGSASANKDGLCINTTIGMANVQHCSFHDGNGYWITLYAANVAGVTIQDNVGYNLAGTNAAVYMIGTANPANVIARNWWMTLGGNGFSFDGYCAVSDNVVVGAAALCGAYLFNKVVTNLSWFSGNSAHSCAGYALQFPAVATITAATLDNFSYYNVGSGIYVASLTDHFTIANGVIGYGAINDHIYTALADYDLLMSGATFGNTSYCPNGKLLNLITANTPYTAIVDSCNLRPAVTGVTAIACLVNFAAALAGQVTVRNCQQTSDLATMVTGINGARAMSWVRVEQWDQTAGWHAYFVPKGIVTRDTARFVTASPGQRVYGINGGAGYMESGPKQIGVDTAGIATWRVRVRKSSLSDGDAANYVGSQPELVLRQCYDGGIVDDVVLDTAAAALGEWEELAGDSPAMSGPGVQEAFVRITNNSNTQFITLDDWQVMVA